MMVPSNTPQVKGTGTCCTTNVVGSSEAEKGIHTKNTTHPLHAQRQRTPGGNVSLLPIELVEDNLVAERG